MQLIVKLVYLHSMRFDLKMIKRKNLRKNTKKPKNLYCEKGNN